MSKPLATTYRTSSNPGKRNLEKASVGHVPFKIQYGLSMAKQFRFSANPVYQTHPEAVDLYTSNTNEIAYTLGETQGLPWALTSINGLGTKEKEIFPQDEEMQRIALESKIKPLGTCLSTLNERDGNRSQLAITASGMRGGYATYDMPFGKYAKVACPPLKLLREMKSSAFAPGNSREKVTLIYEPHTAEANSEYATRLIRESVNNPINFKKTFDMNYREHSKKHAAIAQILNEKILSALIIIGKLIEARVIDDITFLGNYNLDPRAAASPSEKICALASVLGVLGKSYTVDNTVTGEEFVRRYAPVKETLLKAITWNGKEANYGFGYNANTRQNPGIRDGKVLTNTAHGKMLDLQMKSLRESVMATEDLISEQWRLITGKIVYAANRGTDFVQI